MKHIYSKNILPYFREVIPELKIIENYGDNEYTYRIISYLFEAGEVPNQDEFIETLKTDLSVNEEKIMTLAQQYEAVGRAEGRVEGRVEGRAEGKNEALYEMAIRLLRSGNMDLAKISQLTEMPIKTLQALQVKFAEEYS